MAEGATVAVGAAGALVATAVALDDAADEAGADDDDGATLEDATDDDGATLDATDDDAAGALVGGAAVGAGVGAGAQAASATRTINMKTNRNLRFICFFSSKRIKCVFLLTNDLIILLVTSNSQKDEG